MRSAYIAAARRTPIGKLNGALSVLSASELGAVATAALLKDADLDPGAIDEVIMGQVLTGGAGQNPARQTALKAGLPVTTPAMGVNQVCGAGQRSLHLAAQAIKCGDADLIVAGGQDSMSQAPHLLYGVRTGVRSGDQRLVDSMVVDGLWDAFHDVHMGTTVERLASRYQVTRAEQDEFALGSQRRAAAAMAANAFESELAPATIDRGRKPGVVERDEHPNPETTLDKLAAMRPAFDPEGTLTAGNSSGLNDGAAATLVASEDALRSHGLEPLARIAAYASAAVEPMDMGLGPIAASRRALEIAGWTVDDLDILEVNEAFAAQAIIVNREMGWDPARINRLGGAIALGHPLAGSGARIVVTLAHQMRRSGARKGLATLCIGGGQGVAICLER
ncbi:acetyl-CoA C-acetyltransferase [Mesorhizobium sp. VK9D]|uniref:acetyl-CoA C-acetyltransferase n=1 Tax=Mesorhizobium australafricanum TaxID=3072311 RepID=UPI002A23D2A8|nr:acetyl-CoA C-acetyltransferase [Mesorhizobium sp. VK9D]MDX8452328.1 acetyl-CoA C-acetyltransferase [Mesorhizobium sp. VK9D]